MSQYEYSFMDRVVDIRSEILCIEENVTKLKDVVKDDELLPESDRSEIIANVMLAYRHLEDARMRIGKAIQAYDGGASVYDK